MGDGIMNVGDNIRLVEAGNTYRVVDVSDTTFAISIDGVKFMAYKYAAPFAEVVKSDSDYPLGSVVTATIGEYQSGKRLTLVKADTRHDSECWYVPEKGLWYEFDDLENMEDVK
jgi:hypothetical protein